MTLAAVREALADACESIGLNCTGYIMDDVATPAASIAIQPFDYPLVMLESRAPIEFVVHVYTDRTDELTAQQFFDELIDPTNSNGLKPTLEASAVATAAGVDYVWVKGLSSPVQQVQFGSINYLSIEFTVEVVI